MSEEVLIIIRCQNKYSDVRRNIQISEEVFICPDKQSDVKRSIQMSE